MRLTKGNKCGGTVAWAAKNAENTSFALKTARFLAATVTKKAQILKTIGASDGAFKSQRCC